MKCNEQNDILLSACFPFRGFIGNCIHKFCQSCFRKENTNLASEPTYSFTCPCCHASFHDNMRSIDEAILIGEAVTMITHIDPQLIQPKSTEITEENISCVHEANKRVIEKLEAALLLNPNNFYTLYLLFLNCSKVYCFLQNHRVIYYPINFYGLRVVDYSYKLLDHPTIPTQYDHIKSDCCHNLSCTFSVFCNYSAALKYSKLAYEFCLRSSNYSRLSIFKDSYFKYRAILAEQPPLRFGVGDEVEFLHELETGSEWKRGRIVELYYRERDFDIPFSAPYRLQPLDDSADQPPVYAWVKADADRYVRKVGVRSIEDTRYQSRLDAKVMELAQVYCSEEFTQDLYRTLAQDQDFVEMLRSVWQVELSERMLNIYRMLVMYRQPLVRTDSGYHVPSSEEVIAGIKAYFDPIHLSGEAAPSSMCESGDSPRVRAQFFSRVFGKSTDTSGKSGDSQRVIGEILGTSADTPPAMDDSDVQGHLSASIADFLMVLTQGGYLNIVAGLHAGSYFAAPQEIAEAISKASTKYAIRPLLTDAIVNTKVGCLLSAWNGVLTCLENPDAGPSCECPWIYFLVKYYLDHSAGVPKLALALYDRMNTQLSREFIRCANPTCELNRLDKSIGQVKFKKCGRCQAVIYCSRECQVAHYPEHKRLCKARSTC